MKRSLVFAKFLVLILFSVSAHSALVKFSFIGQVTSAENDAALIWDPDAIIGTSVQGYFLLNTSFLVSGRQETGYYYWWNIDNGPGALTSSFTALGELYLLTAVNDYYAMYGWRTDEFIGVNNGPDFDSGPIADSLFLRDQGLFETTVSHGELWQRQRLSIDFWDFINNFLTFPDGFSDDNPPRLDQEFVWFDDDPQSSEQYGTGVFDYRQSLYGNQDLQRLIDSRLDFRLTQVSSSIVTVSEPSILWLLMTGLGLLCLRKTIQWRALKGPE